MSRSRRIGVTLLLALAMLSQATPIPAQTTGGVSGYVTDETGAPIAGATVTAVSPSATDSVQTDAKGHYVFLSLPPDTYVISSSTPGFQPTSVSGIAVFASQMQIVALRSPHQIKTIATVSSTADGLVKPGTSADVYSVNPTVQQIVGTTLNGYNLNSAYSGIYSQPGVTAYSTNNGDGQDFYIRGASYGQTGYEFDGVPVNRPFDNYNGNSLSSLGQQELEVYTGGSPASASSATLGGYINQVIKTGTYPGYGDAQLGVGGYAFYHQLKLEVGGASPNRLFSYYVGFEGYNQQYRLFNNDNGGDISANGENPYGLLGNFQNAYALFNTNAYVNGPFPACPDQNALLNPSNKFPCNVYGAQAAGYMNGYADREVIGNFHFMIPHKHDGGSDDIQLLIDSSYVQETYADSVNDLGGLSTYNNVFAFLGGAAAGYCAITSSVGPLYGYSSGNCASGGPTPFPYQDGYIYANGTKFGANASTAGLTPYYFPGASSQDPLYYGISPNLEGTLGYNTSILKVQYQKNFNTTSYARLTAYSYYNDWSMNNAPEATMYYALVGAGFLGNLDYPTPDYLEDTHQTGGTFEYVNQINAANLVQFSANINSSRINRFNSSTWLGNGLNTTSTNLVGSNGDCYDFTTGAVASCFSGAPLFFPCTSCGTYGSPTQGNPETACTFLPATAACAADASWIVTRQSGVGELNQVKPVFTTFSLTDEWRPSDRLDINAGVRLENYTYDLANSNDPMDQFWFTQAQQSFCYNPATLQALLEPSFTPAFPPIPYSTAPGNACPGSDVHPDGQSGHILFTNMSPASFSHTLLSPRLGATYTLNSDTVLRFTAGRYTQPTVAATEQYLNQYGQSAACSDYAEFFDLGYYSPAHDNPIQSSDNFDLSLEKHLRGTDLSFKVTPFYRDTHNQSVAVPLGQGSISLVNVGIERSYGVEFQLQKGDPNRDGFSGSISYTYTNASMRFGNLPNGQNAIDYLNGYITAFNALTKSGGGFPCYNNTTATPGVGPVLTSTGTNTCTATSIANPYYNMPAEALLNPNGFYPVYPNVPPTETAADNTTQSAISPNYITGWIQWRHKKFAIAPNFTIAEGTSYGSPAAIYGLDPQACFTNQGTAGVVSSSSPYALYGDYYDCGFSKSVSNGYLAVPDPYTGSFDSMGQYREPTQLDIGMQVRYDLSPKVTVVLALANLYNTCFGGSSTPWSNAFPPNHYTCEYDNFYTQQWTGTIPGEGFFYGASPTDPANGTGGFPPEMQYPYQPTFAPNSESTALPFQAYLEFLIKL